MFYRALKARTHAFYALPPINNPRAIQLGVYLALSTTTRAAIAEKSSHRPRLMRERYLDVRTLFFTFHIGTEIMRQVDVEAKANEIIGTRNDDFCTLRHRKIVSITFDDQERWAFFKYL